MSDLAKPLGAAARQFRTVVLGVGADQLTAPTPCTDYDVRGLLNHLLYWTPRLLAAARKVPPPPPEPGEADSRLVTGDWAGLLASHVADLATALQASRAWEGTTSMGWNELPAPMIGRMVLCEFVVHGWDLAVATGQPVRCDPAVAEAGEQVMRAMAESGRAMNVFGPEVPVTPDASALDRALAISGRDPAWRPAARDSRVRAQDSRA